MPNRRLCDLFVLLASALLEAALRLRPEPSPRHRRRSMRGMGAFALAWLGALAATAAAAASGRADALSARVPKQTWEIDCPARTPTAAASHRPDVTGRPAPPAEPSRSADVGRTGAAPPVVVRPFGAARPSAAVPAPATTAPPAGGTAPALAPAQALRASFYRGDPRALDVLPPATTHRDGDVETSTWDFADDATMPVWIACVYGGDEVLAARALPSGTRACSARLRITPMGDPVGLLAVSCR